MLDMPDNARLSALYDELRLRLLDLTRRNQLINYSLSPRSRRFLHIVDGTLENIHATFAGEEASLALTPLPEPDSIPLDERTAEFRAEFERAKTIDVEYLTALEAIEATGRDDEAALDKLDRALRDRVRASLGLPPRPSRKELNRAEHARVLGIEPNLDLAPDRNVDVTRLQTMKFPDELEAILDKISAGARLAEQEMGLSTLYLAFGFLEWYESEDSDKKAFAPLLLLPVVIEKEKVRGRTVYSLSVREGGAEANLSLQKLVESRHSRKLPDFEVDGENGAGSIEAYIAQVELAIEGLKRWQVRRWLVLGHFSFGRFAMYSDLDPEKWGDVVSHDLVGSILRGVEQKADPNSLPGAPEDYPIDDPAVEGIAPFLIQDADASQHSALVDVMKGKNLVIQGPPGTGKSQTITNVIANLLASGKRVLFLAEKQAALDVVKRRLDGAGLGDFCLELHSDKVSPKSVIASLAARHQFGTRPGGAHATTPIDPSWQSNRREITSYVSALNREGDDGDCAFDLIWKALRMRRAFAGGKDAFKDVKIPTELLREPLRLADLRGEIGVLAGMQADFSREFGHPAQSVWSHVPFGDFPKYEADAFIGTVTSLRHHTTASKNALEKHAAIGACDTSDFSIIAAVDHALGRPADGGLIEDVACLDLADLERALSLRGDLLAIEAELATMPGLRHEDPERLALAATHLKAPSSAEFGDCMPDDAYEQAAAQIALLTQLSHSLGCVVPVLEALDISAEVPSAWLPAAATAAVVLAMTPEREGRWMLTLPSADESTVAAAQARLKSLIEEDAAWLERLPGYRTDSRPSPRVLEDAAATLRKGGFGKLAAKIGGAYRDAVEVCRTLGTAPDAPDDLEALARHLAALSAFEGDTQLRSLFGEAWAALETPVDAVLGGLRIRNLMHLRMEPLAGGSEILARVAALAPAQLNAFQTHLDACRKFLALSAPAKEKLDAAPVAEVLASSRIRIVALQDFLAIDPVRRLAGIGASFRQTARAHDLLGKAERIRQALAGQATAASAIRLGSSPARIAATGQAIGWVRAVHALAMHDVLRTRLLSRDAGTVREAVAAAARDWEGLRQQGDAVLAGLAAFGAESLADMPHAERASLIDRLEAHAVELPSFVTLRQQRRKLDEAGLAELLALCDRLAISPEGVPVLFDALIAERRAMLARRVPALATSNGAALETRRQSFAERDKLKIAADRETIRKRLLAASVPSGTNLGLRKHWTDMCLLANEFEKQKRFTPVRQLVNRAGGAMQALKPCFMMSPLSLAKFAGPNSLKFDVLVIDEASQMLPEDALGGMLRARQIVVVGDPKQLPPTDFFARAANDGGTADDDEEDIDAESILEACQTTFGQRRRLKWHYRSRCESLIAFSNVAFYEGSLITFPSAQPGSFSVDLIRVNGAYRAQRNPDEAARVAQEAISFMRHFADAPEKKLPTLGIVAINSTQSELIQEELRRLSADDILVERYREKAQSKGEPLFVKNLENVQGDERDYIFISMTYGKKHGESVLAQSFGPINRKQGHRRLNVLFTRARVRVGLFTSFGSTDVRPTEKSSEGVHALSRYLAYAETRGRASVRREGGEPDSDFEIEVADRLRNRGFDVRSQVGVSGFRIDLGVRHPDHPEHFLAGVECDGATYHSSKSARDRDRLREQVLNDLGWNLVRVWSTDWFDDPDRETEKLVRRLEELRQRERSPLHEYRPLYDEDDAAFSADKDDAEEAGEGEALSGDAQSTAREEPDMSPLTGVPSEWVDGADFLARGGPLTSAEATKALGAFRETRIRAAADEWDGQRSILRPAMIETFVQQRVNEPELWYSRIPTYLRTGTNPAEKVRFLEDICEIVSRIEAGGVR